MVYETVRNWLVGTSNGAIALTVLVVAVLLYGTFVLRELLPALAVAAPAAGLYLLWRLVRATERVAVAAEAVAADSDGES